VTHRIRIKISCSALMSTHDVCSRNRVPLLSWFLLPGLILASPWHLLEPFIHLFFFLSLPFLLFSYPFLIFVRCLLFKTSLALISWTNIHILMVWALAHMSFLFTKHGECLLTYYTVARSPRQCQSLSHKKLWRAYQWCVRVGNIFVKPLSTMHVK